MLTKDTVIFSSTGFQVLSATIHFLGVSILTHCISQRFSTADFSSTIRSINWPRLCILLVFIDSWLFLFSSGLLIFGIGLAANSRVCSSAIYVCIVFYASSKILIYAFLIEKVHVVWSPAAGNQRFKSPIYICCMILLFAYAAVIGSVMLIGNLHHIRGDGVCVIGLKPLATIPMLTCDFTLNVVLTGLFIWPLLNSKVLNPKIRRVASRTLIAATAALTTSLVNILILTLLHGKQLGWVCLGSCGSDVILNALALFWVTGRASGLNGSGVVIALTDRARPAMMGRGVSSMQYTSPHANLKDDAAAAEASGDGSSPQEDGDDAALPTVRRKLNPGSDGKLASVFTSVANFFTGKETEQEIESVHVTITTEVETFTNREGSAHLEYGVGDKRRDKKVLPL